MKPADELIQENKALRDRLSRLSRASLRINESLDFDAVLQSVLDSARSLTGARYGVLTLLDETGQADDFLSSGMTSQEAQGPVGPARCIETLRTPRQYPEPLRLPDLIGHIRAFNLPEPPLPGGATSSALLPGGAHPPRRRTRRQHLSRRDGGRQRVHFRR